MAAKRREARETLGRPLLVKECEGIACGMWWLPWSPAKLVSRSHWVRRKELAWSQSAGSQTQLCQAQHNLGERVTVTLGLLLCQVGKIASTWMKAMKWKEGQDRFPGLVEEILCR